jgi:hypothetical protein
MKYLLIALAFLGSAEGFAQVATAPDGAANISAPPVGSSRISKCGKKGCFEIKLQPFCFGTNLRAYSPDIQLKQNEDVVIKVSLGGAGGDQINVKFPAALTYASDGVKVNCTPLAGQNMATSGSRNFQCVVPDPAGDKVLTYAIPQWRGPKNPSCYANGGSHGQEYCDYAARPLPGNLVQGAHPDASITCLYTFDSSYKIKPEVKCSFPSMLADESSKVKVSIAGVDSNATEVKAITNSISVGIPLNEIAWVKGNSQLSKGTFVMPKNGGSLPAAQVKFFQVPVGGTTERELEKSGYSLPDKIVAYDEVNNNMSLTISAKFPGAAGFCGGFYSPLMLFFDKAYPQFSGMSLFPLHGVKAGSRVNWPEAGAPGYFLALLGKGESEISKSSQLFGQSDDMSNGFESLKVHDSDKNGVINKKDKIWASLKLWKDENANGMSEKEEIHSLDSKGVESLSLAYSTRDPKNFDNRARVRESSKFSYRVKGKLAQAEILDVWFTPID